MEKSTAAGIVKALTELDHQLNDIDAQLRNLPDEGERRVLLRALGSIIADLDSDLIRPLVRQYPDLDPDR